MSNLKLKSVINGASDLVKSSCRQLAFYNFSPDKRKPVSEMQKAGEQWQAEHVRSEYIEMRGCAKNILHDNYLIMYSVDEIFLGPNAVPEFCEYKMVTGTPAQYYLEGALLQCALYSTLHIYSDHKYQTSTFRLQQGYSEHVLNAGVIIDYTLQFGENKYIITVHDHHAIMRFFCEKQLCSWDWTKATAFDSKYKHKEFETLKNYFSFELLNINT